MRDKAQEGIILCQNVDVSQSKNNINICYVACATEIYMNIRLY